ncbi:hypothetical protein ABZT06_50500, partial [Streptomyces sp. NPDC005483]|uniref:hypothetical protein n=1 Tax=Streptomyces sp. NPDC005483 TaxID=3154882 RepID=UPI0033AC8912
MAERFHQWADRDLPYLTHVRIEDGELICLDRYFVLVFRALEPEIVSHVLVGAAAAQPMFGD